MPRKGILVIFFIFLSFTPTYGAETNKVLSGNILVIESRGDYLVNSTRIIIQNDKDRIFLGNVLAEIYSHKTMIEHKVVVRTLDEHIESLKILDTVQKDEKFPRINLQKIRNKLSHQLSKYRAVIKKNSFEKPLEESKANEKSRKRGARDCIASAYCFQDTLGHVSQGIGCSVVIGKITRWGKQHEDNGHTVEYKSCTCVPF